MPNNWTWSKSSSDRYAQQWSQSQWPAAARQRTTGHTTANYNNILRSHVQAQSQVLSEVGYVGSVVASYSSHLIAATTAAQLVGQMGELIATFASAMSEEINQSQSTFVMDVYSEIAEKARLKVLEAFRAGANKHRLQYRGGDPGEYKRYSDGKMLQALSEPGSLFRITPDGIEYVIPAVLDARAPQWYRLNFGAAPANTPAPRQFSIYFFDTKLPGIGFQDAPASRPFSMPAGMWSNISAATTAEFSNKANKKGVKQADIAGGGAFYPASLMSGRARGWTQSGRRTTKGIVGARFLDYGAQSLNRDIGPALEYIARTWVAQAAGEISRPASGGSPLNMTEQGAGQWLKILNERLETTSRNNRATQEKLRVRAAEIKQMAPYRRGYSR